MAYEPTQWQAGDTITSAKLNKLEQGVSDSSNNGGVFIVEITATEVEDFTPVTPAN